ncbi:GGDEF domain-containing protein [Catellatospora paridis]|uniref:GGDEF domain-containing protein n=1 Tax=Catellatospora paridis TaxID=1617086 RepID=UPI0012D3FD77|nr:GGDEF domain-containing protein [Catellatospora paridis]
MSHTLYLFGLLALAAFGGWLTGRRQRNTALQTQVNELNGQLWQARHVNPLTGLRNRADAETRIAAMIAARGPVCVGFADLDRFKELNDSYGHATGDRALQHFATVVRALLPDLFVWHLHGDEFVFAWRSTLDEGLIHAQYLRHLVGVNPMPLPDGGSIALKMSIGLAAPAAGIDVALLLHQADLAMHDAKGRPSGIASYDPRHGATTLAVRPARRARDQRHDLADAAVHEPVV